MEIRGFKVRTIGNAIRGLRYHKKEIGCRAIEDFRAGEEGGKQFTSLRCGPISDFPDLVDIR